MPSLVINEKLLFKEIEKLKRLKCSLFLKIYKVYENRNSYYIITEYIKGGDLYDIMDIHQRMIESQAAKIVFQLLFTISRLQDSDHILNDIKPENILFTDVNNLLLKFNTLNLFNIIRDYPTDSIFLSPEAKKGKLNDKGDSWSIGIITYYLLSGKLPEKKDCQFCFKDINHKFLESISSKAKDFLANLLTNDFNQRLSIKDSLNHSWILDFPISDELEIIY